MRKRFSQINIVPFVDIILVLLVITLATATFMMQNSLKIDIPSSKGESIPTKAKSIEIAIDKNGFFYINNKRVSFNKLKIEILKLNPKKDLITIKADKKSYFDKFVKVISLLKEKGFKNVSIITQTPS